MSAILKVIFLLVIPGFCAAQSTAIDSLTSVLTREKQDTNRVLLLAALSNAYLSSRPDTALVLAQQGLALSKRQALRKAKPFALTA